MSPKQRCSEHHLPRIINQYSQNRMSPDLSCARGNMIIPHICDDIVALARPCVDLYRVLQNANIIDCACRDVGLTRVRVTVLFHFQFKVAFGHFVSPACRPISSPDPPVSVMVPFATSA